ncbi:MAG TPA: flagellar motor switch protein FliG [Solirubrobacteraceae bacterium]|jgi:flagellar motor switch protein FliG|nr:flagellar motor switch protein FliG [Solirubrobacteraceae bacterium]
MDGDAPAGTLPALSPADSDLLPATVSSPDLRGIRKAAMLMTALGSERAANVLQRLGEAEIESLSLEMSTISSVAAETTETIFGELAELAKREADVNGGMDFARGVIERALGPERAAELLDRLSAHTEAAPFEFLQRVPPERIAALLRSESPQTIALILASVQTSLAAQVLARLPEPQQPDIALRIARMGETSAQVVEQVEEVIRHKLTAVVEREYSAAGGTKTLAEILNHSDRTTERAVLENLATTDEELAEEVRGMLFVFEDIAKLEERAIQQVLREADQKDLVLALRGAPENVKEIILTNMSERGAEMIKEEMEIQPPQRKRDIDAAQSRIVAVVRRLEESGAIVIVGDSEDESDAVV